MEDSSEDNDRRKFLKFGLLAGGATLAAGLGLKSNPTVAAETGKKVKEIGRAHV